MERHPVPAELTRISLLDELTAIASEAAVAILRVRGPDIAVRSKADDSPVTEADQAAHDVIMAGLGKLLPGMVVVSEEAEAAPSVASLPETFVLVDPLDGTKEFISGRDEFTVNIAIVYRERPVCGVVGAPVLNTIWRGAIGTGAERLTLVSGAVADQASARSVLKASPHRGGPWRAMVSRSHADPKTEQWLQRFTEIERMDCGSSVKFCRIAEGRADIYPRLGRTSEWDIAAGDAVLSAAGGIVLTPEGERLCYGQMSRDLKVPSFVAWADPADARRYSAAS